MLPCTAHHIFFLENQPKWKGHNIYAFVYNNDTNTHTIFLQVTGKEAQKYISPKQTENTQTFNSNDCLTSEDGSIGCPEISINTHLHDVTTQRSGYLIYTVSETWSHALPNIIRVTVSRWDGLGMQHVLGRKEYILGFEGNIWRKESTLKTLP